MNPPRPPPSPARRELPFKGKSSNDVFFALKNKEADFGSPLWRNISASAQDLLRRILTKDPLKRISAQEVRNLPPLGLKPVNVLYVAPPLGDIHGRIDIHQSTRGSNATTRGKLNWTATWFTL